MKKKKTKKSKKKLVNISKQNDAKTKKKLTVNLGSINHYTKKN